MSLFATIAPPEDIRVSLKAGLKSSARMPPEQGPYAKGLLHKWFDKEAPWLTGINFSASLALLASTMQMTMLGMKIAMALHVVEATGFLATIVTPYLAIALCALGAAKALHTWFTRRKSKGAKVLGFAAAGLLLTGGLFEAALNFYAVGIPSFMKSGLAMGNDSVTTAFRYVSRTILPYVQPALAATLGLLFSAKQTKTLFSGKTGRAQKYVALLGLASSLGTAAIAGYASWYHHQTGGFLTDQPESRHYLANPPPDAMNAIAAPFAHGTQCRLSDSYGWRLNPFNHHLSEFHPGIDVAGPEGTPIGSVVSGKVMFAGHDGPFGNMVAIKIDPHSTFDDNGSSSLTVVAGHMQKVLVHPGDHVMAGDVIGTIGSSGRSTGPHVHYQVCLDGQATPHGDFVCGPTRDPNEMWPVLSGVARMKCKDGPPL